mgnify:CR=1 FL=1
MALNAAAGLGGMLKDGHKSFEGTNGAVLRNVEAGKAIAGMVQTSLGPNGMNKLVVNHLEKIIVTSDCATIVKELEIQHPAAKILVMGSEMQESEYGDNTNFVISFGGELLKMAQDLIQDGLHTAEIVEGYQRAYAKALEILETLVVKTVVDMRDEQQVTVAIKNCIATKQYGYEDLLTKLVVQACKTVMPPAATAERGKKVDFSLDSVRFAKLRGGAVDASTMLQGMVVLRDTEGVVKKAENAKVLVLGIALQATEAEAKGTVLIRNAEELLNYNKSEEKKMEEIIKGIAASGVKVVISNGQVSEMALHFCDKYDLMVMKIQSKFELRRLCGALGASACVRLGAPTPEEMGEVSSIEVKEISGRKITVIQQANAEDTNVATIVIRAATEQVANDVERALDDGTHSVKTLCGDPRLLPGAGAVELELGRKLKEFADETKGLDQYAIRKFADALDVVPRTLAENSGCDPTSMMHTLHSAHPADGSGATMGFDVEECVARDSVNAEIFDIYATKVNALRLAVDAAVTILKVDQIVMSKPAGGPKPGGPGGGPPGM